ncbi:MAG TPA: hypothetical protein VH913_19675 [Hyphomicrobiaceae bacterium]|jgi:hypothetical protein
MPRRVRTDENAKRGARRKLDAELDKALAQTFPASDPFSVGQSTGTEPPSRPVDRRRRGPSPRRAAAVSGRRRQRSMRMRWRRA